MILAWRGRGSITSCSAGADDLSLERSWFYKRLAPQEQDDLSLERSWFYKRLAPQEQDDLSLERSWFYKRLAP